MTRANNKTPMNPADPIRLTTAYKVATMKLFCGIGILGSLVLAGCSDAAREASSNTAPVAQQVTLSTANLPAYINTVLNGSFRYADGDGDVESGTLKAWLRDGQPIEGADQDSYTATAQDLDKTLQYRVTPAAATGKSPGAAVLSSGIKIENSPPRISGLVIGGNLSGPADTGDVLTLSYNFHDADGNGEGASEYEWLRDGVAIGGAIKNSYMLTLDDAGKTITVKVTPLARTGASPGLPVVSNAVKVVSPNAVLTVSAGLRQLRFSWAPVRGMSTYRLSYNPDGVSGFIPLSGDSNKLTATTYDWDISVHRINWPKAQFMLEACDNVNCLPSASISALDVMLGAIGYFKANNTEATNYFGTSVALSANGNTLAVGATGEDSNSTGIDSTPNEEAPFAGAVYVYTRSGITWSQQAYVKASNTGAGDSFGFSVALSADGNTLAVGAPYEDSSSTGISSTPNELASGAGAVYVYTRNGIIWSPQAYLKASNTGVVDSFGSSVALSTDGNTLAVGASGEDSAKTGVIPGAPTETTTPNDALGEDSGAVYVYARSENIWTQQAYVKASNTGFDDYFGYSVALSANGNTLAVGATREDSRSTGIDSTPNEAARAAGAVYVYTRSVTFIWTQQAYVKASNPGAYDYFGSSVALSADGDTLAVGSNEASSSIGIGSTPNEAAPSAGTVYVYTRGGVTWTQQAYVKASNTGDSDYFGLSLALSADGNTLAVGAPYEGSAKTGIIPGAPVQTETDTPNAASGSSSGAIYLFTRSGITWTQQAYVKASNTGVGDSFGISVALSANGNTLAAGASGEASAATGVNNTMPGQADNTALSVGAVYLY